ncbi:MAG: hypothetical protein JWM09_1429 [Francisellaceae bacterium]|nr:hypothetical protein [Francisellaceae bacterium]
MGNLLDLNVLITRPEGAQHNLIKKIENLGGNTHYYPAIENKLLDDLKYLKQTLKNIPRVDKIIFISKTSTLKLIPYLKKHFTNFPKLQWMSVGPGTASCLLEQGIKEVITPTTPPFNSESFLKLNCLNDIKNQTILIVRADKGREVIRDTLVERGARVEYITSYKRILPPPPPPNLVNWVSLKADVIITTSYESIGNVLKLFKDIEKPKILSIPILVVGQRNTKQAESLGFTTIIEASAADDEHIIQALVDRYPINRC